MSAKIVLHSYKENMAPCSKNLNTVLCLYLSTYRYVKINFKCHISFVHTLCGHNVQKSCISLWNLCWDAVGLSAISMTWDTSQTNLPAQLMPQLSWSEDLLLTCDATETTGLKQSVGFWKPFVYCYICNDLGLWCNLCENRKLYTATGILTEQQSLKVYSADPSNWFSIPRVRFGAVDMKENTSQCLFSIHIVFQFIL